MAVAYSPLRGECERERGREVEKSMRGGRRGKQGMRDERRRVENIMKEKKI